mmetsp:Transcript_19339/g.32116  ORF Transcript_19339/g.32116 Transcript_19339/m.32116 type:complete len:109 (+) Transcript_19339:542-868(+)
MFNSLRLFLLVEFRVDNARLSGAIPSELARCTALKSFSVGNNRMTGTLPVDLEELEELEELNIWSTGISGTFPSGICDHGYGKVVTTHIEFPGCTCCTVLDNNGEMVP